MATTPAWQRKEGQNPKGGLNATGRASAKAEGPFRHDLMALHDIPVAGTEAEADYANITRIPR